ncbi:MAG TPA: GtrA family protein [Syntrophales bacterium]|nr:GtrA family protein [Syntrophales bacterium]
MNGLRKVKAAVVEALSQLPGGEWLLRQRFLKFGAVGFLGTLVNLAVLYLAQESVFRGIENPHLQLNLSLAAAIFVSTLHNFVWNRAWTWGDRKIHIRKGITLQFFQYCAACWLSIVLQVVFTNAFQQYMHYLPANMLAIAITAVLNYLINHSWTFKVQKQPAEKE